jgi:hypothetical protein
MKHVNTAIAVLAASLLMAACGPKETTAAPEAAAPAAAEAPPAAPANAEDASQTSGDKVAPTTQAPATTPTG